MSHAEFVVALWAPDASPTFRSKKYDTFIRFPVKEQNLDEVVHILISTMKSVYNSDTGRYEFVSKEDLFLALEKILHLIT